MTAQDAAPPVRVAVHGLLAREGRLHLGELKTVTSDE
jgi:hypothetical protein